MSYAEKFLEALKKGILILHEKEKEEHPRIIGKYHPSSIGDCLRKQYYEFYIEETPSEEKLVIFATGKGVHEIITKILKESNVIQVEASEFDTELDFGEYKLHGRVDIIILNVDSEKAIVEVKTVSKLPKEPLQKHILQLQTYLHALKLNNGILLYWDKRKGKLKTFSIVKDDNILKILKERTHVLHEHIVNKKEPIKEMAIKEEYFECLNCPYKEICKPLKMDIEEGSEIVVLEIENVLLNTEKRKEACLKELNLDLNTDLKEIDSSLREKFFNLYYSEKYLSYDEPIHENINKALKYYMQNKSLVIVTNRPKKMKKATIDQLIDLGIPYEQIFMRNDFHKGLEFKLAIIKLLQLSGYKIYDIMDEEKTLKKIKKRLNL